MFQESLNAFAKITPLEIFAFLIPFVLAIWIDLRSHKKGETVTMGNATMWSGIWVLCSLAFAGFIFWERGLPSASLFATGYALEKALAIDNLFAFYLIFKDFGFTKSENQSFQHKILYWGILGAIVFRVAFLGVGAFIVNVSPLVLVVFAVIIILTVIKMWRASGGNEETDYANHWSVRLVRKFVKVNPSIDSGKFFFLGATPLFLCLVCIEICDLVFAFDSMPVIIAVVQDPYLMITSSLWAAAGLRSLYFLLVAAQGKFWALDKAVMVLLLFVSGKLIGSAFHFHIPNEISLSIVGTILATGVGWSLFFKNPEESTESAS